MRRFGLRDDQWERIKHLLPGREGSVGATAADNRLFVEAVIYRYRAGVPWRDLPERFGDWENVHRRFSRWAQSGVWERVFQLLAADADNEYAMIDSSKCQPLAAGLGGGAACVAEDGFHRHGSSSPMSRMGCSAMRARTSAR